MDNVSMFIPCSVDLLLPETGKSLYYLLKHLKKKPVYHGEQTCCGQPALSSGYLKKAVEAAKHFITVFEKDDVIVSLSGSCAHTVKYQYPKILKDHPDWLKRAQSVSGKIFDITQYIVDVLQIEEIGAKFSGKVAYHESCRILRGLGVSDQPVKLINGVENCELLPLNAADSCCGFGGEFSFNYPSISEAIVKEKSDNFINSGADLLLLADPGCLLNINGYLQKHHPGKRAMHIADFLYKNIGGAL